MVQCVVFGKVPLAGMGDGQELEAGKTEVLLDATRGH